MLKSLHLGDGHNIGTADGSIALDCSVRKTRQGHYCISTTDFFFPLVDSPYVQGWIGAANVLSDLYAQGIQECDFMLMLLAACRDMPEKERTICTSEMVKGFRDACTEADVPITGGQTVLNPWPIIGGVVTSIVAEGEFIPSDGAKAGNIVVLTKPLGTQVAVNIHQWRNEKHRLWSKCLDESIITTEIADEMIHDAICSMTRLNKSGASLMVKYKATSATDVTGFGLVGHAQNLMENQSSVTKLGMDIHTLPCLAGSAAVNQSVFDFGLTKGYSAETSGGLLVCFPSEVEALGFCKELEELDDSPCWIIGKVIIDDEKDGGGKARIVEDCKIVEV